MTCVNHHHSGTKCQPGLNLNPETEHTRLVLVQHIHMQTSLTHHKPPEHEDIDYGHHSVCCDLALHLCLQIYAQNHISNINRYPSIVKWKYQFAYTVTNQQLQCSLALYCHGNIWELPQCAQWHPPNLSKYLNMI